MPALRSPSCFAGLIAASVLATAPSIGHAQFSGFVRDFAGWGLETEDDIDGSQRPAGAGVLITDDVVFTSNTSLLSPLEFGDVTVKVDMTFHSGGREHWQMVMCRWTPDNITYALGVTGDGWVGIYRLSPDDQGIATLFDPIQFDGIAPIGETNAIRVDCIGDRFAIYVNGRLAAEAFDQVVSSGRVGLGVSALGDEPSTVLFEGVSLSAPAGSSGPSGGPVGRD